MSSILHYRHHLANPGVKPAGDGLLHCFVTNSPLITFGLDGDLLLAILYDEVDALIVTALRQSYLIPESLENSFEKLLELRAAEGRKVDGEQLVTLFDLSVLYRPAELLEQVLFLTQIIIALVPVCGERLAPARAELLEQVPFLTQIIIALALVCGERLTPSQAELLEQAAVLIQNLTPLRLEPSQRLALPAP